MARQNWQGWVSDADKDWSMHVALFLGMPWIVSSCPSVKSGFKEHKGSPGDIQVPQYITWSHSISIEALSCCSQDSCCIVFTWCWHTLETPFYTVPSIIFLGHRSQRWTFGMRSIWGERKFTYGLHTAIIAVAALHESLPQLVLCGDPPDTTHLIITFPTSPGFHRYLTALRDSLI